MDFIKKHKKTIIGLVVFALFFIVNRFIVSFLALLGLDISKFSIIPRQIISILISLIFPIILVIIYKKDFIDDSKKFKGNIRFYIETVVTAYTIGILCMVISNFLIQFALKLPISENEQGIRTLLNALPIYVFISAAIIGPFEEEMVFRKALKDVFKNKKLFILMSGLIFGALHVITSFSNPLELLYIIPYSALGISFAYMYVKTDNIFVSIIVHILHNSFLLALQLLVI